MADLDTWAFPVSTIDGFTEHGMTLRDWFAGQALSGNVVGSFDAGFMSADKTRALALEAYRLADAMLAARTTTPEANS